VVPWLALERVANWVLLVPVLEHDILAIAQEGNSIEFGRCMAWVRCGFDVDVSIRCCKPGLIQLNHDGKGCANIVDRLFDTHVNLLYSAASVHIVIHHLTIIK
jgi:hypothetical protein